MISEPAWKAEQVHGSTLQLQKQSWKPAFPLDSCACSFLIIFSMSYYLIKKD